LRLSVSTDSLLLALNDELLTAHTRVPPDTAEGNFPNGEGDQITTGKTGREVWILPYKHSYRPLSAYSSDVRGLILSHAGMPLAARGLGINLFTAFPSAHQDTIGDFRLAFVQFDLRCIPLLALPIPGQILQSQ
jgi:hypothetical protein